MAPFIVIPLFSHKISSGYGALSIEILVSLIYRSDKGIQEVQKNWRILWQIVALWMKKLLDNWL